MRRACRANWMILRRRNPKYDLFNLNLGDAARIDEAYWELGSRVATR
jgi:hypothetical protein